MRTTVIALAAPTFLLLSTAALAQEPFNAAARASQIAPFVDQQTIIVQHADLARIAPGKLFDVISRVLPVPQEQLDAARQSSEALHRQLVQAGAKEVFGVVSLAGVPHDPQFLVFTLSPTGSSEKLIQALEPLHFETNRPLHGGLFVGSKRALERVQAAKPTVRPELTAAFAAAGDTAAQVLLLPTADTRRVIEGMLPTLPEEIGGGPSTVLTQGIRWAALGIDASPDLSIELVIQSRDAEAAKALEGRIWSMLQMAAEDGEVRAALPKVDELFRLLAPKAKDDRLVLALNRENKGVAGLLQAVAPPMQAARVAARRAQSTNNLKQIALAMHMYHDTHGRFPPAASIDAQSRPLLSWRVHLLPFLNELELYRQFHLNEPWDSEHNRTLIEKMPAVFRSPFAKPDPGRTTYLVPVGDQTIFHNQEGTRMQEIADGTSNTILAVEVDFDHAVIWTNPQDLPFDPQQPERGLGGPYPGGFLAALCDGAVIFHPLPMAADKLRARFTFNGGEVVEWP